MTKLVHRPGSGRGDRRRRELADAALALLVEGGWAAVTTRAVAERAGANLGLVHYHFGGLAGLRLATVRRAEEEMFSPVVDALVSGADVVDVLRTLAGHPLDARTTRLAVELTEGALRDPDVGRVLRDGLRRARDAYAESLRRRRPAWPATRSEGVATLVVALLDGLVLHRALDEGLDVSAAAGALSELAFPEQE